MHRISPYFIFFFFNDTATTEIYTLSLHDALPICPPESFESVTATRAVIPPAPRTPEPIRTSVSGEPSIVRRLSVRGRSEEHTSELQSQSNLVCRLLLEKKKNSIQMYKRQRESHTS